MIILLDGPELMDRVQQFPENFKFYLNDGFNVTLQGGDRDGSSSFQLSSQLRQAVISNSTAEAIRQINAATSTL